MFLSRMTLNPRHRAVRQDLSNRYELHRTVMSAFPDAEGGRTELGVLFRVEDHGRFPVLYVQSSAPPDWSALPEGYVEVDFLSGPPVPKRVDTAWQTLEPGRMLRFRLHANPRKQVFVRGGRGPRLPLRQPEEVIAWLNRRAESAGFSLARVAGGAAAVELRPLDDIVGWKSGANGKRRRITLGAVQVDGRLEVTDGDRFRLALSQGIGGGRAFGLGLLSIAPMT